MVYTGFNGEEKVDNPMKIADVQNLEARLRRDYEEKLKAIQIVKEMLLQEQRTNLDSASGEIPQTAPQSTVMSAVPVIPDDQPTLIDALQHLLERADTPWTGTKAIAQLRSENFVFGSQTPEASVNIALNRLVERQKALLYRKGSGRQPNWYKSTKWTQTPDFVMTATS